MLEQSTILMQVMIGPITLRAVSTAHSLRLCSKPPIDHQPQEAEGGEASEEGRVTSPRICSAYSVVKTRDTPQGYAKSPSRSRRKSLKPKHNKISQSRSCFVLFSVYSGVRGQSTAYSFYCFGKSFSRFPRSITTTTANADCPNSQSTVRRASLGSTTM
jgi:hypothetical protein